MAQFASRVIAASLALVVLVAVSAAQRPDTAAGSPSLASAPRQPVAVVARTAQALPTSAELYEPVLEQFRKMEPQADRVATVRNLTLRRDVIAFHLEEGKVYLATPVAGRAVAAIFVGRGSVSFASPLHVERAQLKRILGDSTLDARITAAAFVFTDSTLAELERQLSFGTGGLAAD
jgi:hypothetical protein